METIGDDIYKVPICKFCKKPIDQLFIYKIEIKNLYNGIIRSYGNHCSIECMINTLEGLKDDKKV